MKSDQLFKVLALEEALASQHPFVDVMVDLRGWGTDGITLQSLAQLGIRAVLGSADWQEQAASAGVLLLHGLKRDDVVAPGDAIRVEARNGRVGVLYRRGANSNSLFITERCNSLCLMCSQPPRPEDDSWRVDELLRLIPLIDRDLPVLGLTGGEPTLPGTGLPRILEAVRDTLPTTQLHILTNGRRFSDPALVRSVEAALGRTMWAIPLYADGARRHDHVVQASGAFEETLEGIHNLAEAGHAIEIRCVVHALTLPRLMGLAEFIWRNMPFVAHVAFMGLEPMGYARRNRDVLWVEPEIAAGAAAEAALHLADRGMAVSLYNLPLCLIPREAWPLARRSISDWKQDYVAECAACEVRSQCPGFFASADASWRGKGIRPVIHQHLEAAP
jgi:His-Xaa-Ser system radical SAM maturase HxsC